uniref:plasmid mobilization protein n=1 Tax=Psychrobacter sp. DAB_AL43B TaxID=1028416 RepID=UPI0002571913|nr:plasmid mobilization relaxosome protein MobC [Psychrobacter sp. DAB_AL43B]AFF18199.1 MobC [Psychrobacter sp. DAB_AL43B]
MPKISRDKRDKEITIRVSEDELTELKKRQQGTTMAGWMRDLGLGVTPMKPADPELVRALGRIGSNLNQVTKHVNIDKTIDKSVLEQITAIRATINALLDDHLRGEP